MKILIKVLLSLLLFDDLKRLRLAKRTRIFPGHTFPQHLAGVAVPLRAHPHIVAFLGVLLEA